MVLSADHKPEDAMLLDDIVVVARGWWMKVAQDHSPRHYLGET